MKYINFDFKEEITDVSLISDELQKFLLCCNYNIYIYIYDNINADYKKIMEFKNLVKYCDLYYDADTNTEKIFCVLDNNNVITLNTEGTDIMNKYILPQEINTDNIQNVIMTSSLARILSDNKLYYIYPDNSYDIIDNVTDITTDQWFYYIQNQNVYSMAYNITDNVKDLNSPNAKEIENYWSGYVYIDNNNELFLQVHRNTDKLKIYKNFNIIKIINNLYNVDNIYTADNEGIFVQKGDKIIILK